MASEERALAGALARAFRESARRPLAVLDFGSGDGRFLGAFARAAAALGPIRVVAYDVSVGALDAFRRRCVARGFVGEGGGDPARVAGGPLSVDFVVGDPLAAPEETRAALARAGGGGGGGAGDPYDVVLSGWGSTSAIPDLDAAGRQDAFVAALADLAPRLVQVASSTNNFLRPQADFANLRAALARAPPGGADRRALAARVRLATNPGDFYYAVAGHEYFYSAVTPAREAARLRAAGFVDVAVDACNVTSFRDLLRSPALRRLEAAALAFIARDDKAGFDRFLRAAVAKATGAPVARAAPLFDPDATLVHQCARYLISAAARAPRRA